MHQPLEQVKTKSGSQQHLVKWYMEYSEVASQTAFYMSLNTTFHFARNLTE
jgi:hypothetical protein